MTWSTRVEKIVYFNVLHTLLDCIQEVRYSDLLRSHLGPKSKAVEERTDPLSPHPSIAHTCSNA